MSLKVDTSSGSPEFRRWWILVLFSLAECLQGLMWMSYSTNPEASRDFLQVGDGTLNWLLNLGPIAFVLTSYLGAATLNRKDGLRLAMLIGAALMLGCAVLRAIPSLLLTAAPGRPYGLAWVVAGQSLNAAAAAFFEPAPALLAQTWFPPSERGTATGIARSSNAIGRAVAFFLGPALVTGAADFPRFLYLHIIFAAIVAVLAVAAYPGAPRQPPSRAAALTAETRAEGTLSQFRRLLCGAGGASFMALVASFGVQMGLYGSWSGTLTTVLTSGSFSAGQAGWIGFWNTIVGILGGVLAGTLLGASPRLATKLRCFLVALCLLASAAFLALAVSLPPLSLGDEGYSWYLTFGAVSGFFRGALDPCYFELSTELAFAHSVQAGTAGTLLTATLHAVMILFLTLGTALPQLFNDIMPLAMALGMLVAALLLLGVRERYDRHRLDHQDADNLDVASRMESPLQGPHEAPAC